LNLWPWTLNAPSGLKGRGALADRSPMYVYFLIWMGIGMIATVIVADRRGFRGWSLVLWVVLGAALGIFAFLLALASSGDDDGDDGHRAFRMSK
jgi:hypothetical protein